MIIDNLDSITGNVERYPSIVTKPKVVDVLGHKYAVYGYKFKGLGQLYNFLKSNPNINTDVFGPKEYVSSLDPDCEFYGIPYDEALEQIVNYHDPQYREFLNISRKVVTRNLNKHSMFKSVNSVAGGIIRPQAIATGDPNIYKTTNIVKQKNEISINVFLGYNSGTSETQVLHRAIILTNIISALEKQGYYVKVNAFEVCIEGSEIIMFKVGIKGTNTGINYQVLYRSLCYVEFFRRLGFRLIECADVKGSWRAGYGAPASRSFCSDLLKLKKDDLFFVQPSDMDIFGYDIGDDFESAVYHLNLQNNIDVEKEKVKVKKGVRDSSLYNKKIAI